MTHPQPKELAQPCLLHPTPHLIFLPPAGFRVSGAGLKNGGIEDFGGAVKTKDA